MSKDQFKGVVLMLAAVILVMAGYIVNDFVGEKQLVDTVTQVPDSQIPGVPDENPVSISPSPSRPSGPTSPVPIKAPAVSTPAPVVRTVSSPVPTPAVSTPAPVARVAPASSATSVSEPVSVSPAPAAKIFSVEITAPDGAKIFLLRKGWDYAKEGRKFTLSPGEYWANANLSGTWGNELQYNILVNGAVLRTVSKGPNMADALWFKISDSGELITSSALTTSSTPTTTPSLPTTTTPDPVINTSPPATTTPSSTVVDPSSIQQIEVTSVAQPEEERSVWATNALFTFGKKK